MTKSKLTRTEQSHTLQPINPTLLLCVKLFKIKLNSILSTSGFPLKVLNIILYRVFGKGYSLLGDINWKSNIFLRHPVCLFNSIPFFLFPKLFPKSLFPLFMEVEVDLDLWMFTSRHSELTTSRVSPLPRLRYFTIHCVLRRNGQICRF